ncbi:MAG: hypothetical protein P4L87_23985 [Formivibrio sp.]|nr:hypothetical protein [Formivibrio sp.]
MALKWIAGLLLLGTLSVYAQAEEKDAPLPFDEPSAAPQYVQRTSMPTVSVRRHTQARKSHRVQPVAHRVKSVKKVAGKSTPKRTVKVVAKKTATKKAVVRKHVAKAPVSRAKKKHR